MSSHPGEILSSVLSESHPPNKDGLPLVKLISRVWGAKGEFIVDSRSQKIGEREGIIVYKYTSHSSNINVLE